MYREGVYRARGSGTSLWKLQNARGQCRVAVHRINRYIYFINLHIITVMIMAARTPH